MRFVVPRALELHLFFCFLHFFLLLRACPSCLCPFLLIVLCLYLSSSIFLRRAVHSYTCLSLRVSTLSHRHVAASDLLVSLLTSTDACSVRHCTRRCPTMSHFRVLACFPIILRTTSVARFDTTPVSCFYTSLDYSEVTRRGLLE